MRPADERKQILDLVAQGVNDCEIARRTGIPRTTVRDIRRPRRRSGRPDQRRRVARNCPRCDGTPLDARDYAYLLGLYLGDGHISRLARTERLRIFCDLRYANLWWGVAGTIERVSQRRASLILSRTSALLVVAAYWNHWQCLFPQHAPGKKHERAITLESWQQELVENDPRPFIRGLIHSDGCRSLNTIRHPKRTYTYPRYQFTNHSDDIRALFCAACDAIGVHWTRMNRWNISIARRADVATLDAFIGPKN